MSRSDLTRVIASTAVAATLLVFMATRPAEAPMPDACRPSGAGVLALFAPQVTAECHAALASTHP